MAEVLYNHAIVHSYLPQEHRAICRGHCGCLDALMVDSMVAREAMVCHCNPSVAWIDYQKAYNRVPHEWLRRVLSSVRAHLSIQHTLDSLRKKWSSVFRVGIGEEAVWMELIYCRGVFQGDSLSSLLHCLSIAPISHAYRKTKGTGCHIWNTQLRTSTSWIT